MNQLEQLSTVKDDCQTEFPANVQQAAGPLRFSNAGGWLKARRFVE